MKYRVIKDDDEITVVTEDGGVACKSRVGDYIY